MTGFPQAVKEACVGYNYPKELIGNMDESPMYFDMSGITTVKRRTISIRTTGAEKRHLTVATDAPTDGHLQGEAEPEEHHCS